jgi:2-keto-3-deoxy-L-rhamnonate aldolase RhmA
MKFIYITSDPYQAKILNEAEIDFVMIDLEINGKEERQRGRDTVISRHSLEDIDSIRKVLNRSKLLVRVNPIWENSIQEINQAINAGADALLLPMFRTAEEVGEFISIVDGRAECQLLLETASALIRIDSILEVKGISTIHVGLNDLHRELNLDFMFELLNCNAIENLSKQILENQIKLGIGGIGMIGGSNLIPPELILQEFVRLGSHQTILSRDFRRIFLEKESNHLIHLKQAILRINETLELARKNNSPQRDTELSTMINKIALGIRSGK